MFYYKTRYRGNTKRHVKLRDTVNRGPVNREITVIYIIVIYITSQCPRVPRTKLLSSLKPRNKQISSPPSSPKKISEPPQSTVTDNRKNGRRRCVTSDMVLTLFWWLRVWQQGGWISPVLPMLSTMTCLMRFVGGVLMQAQRLYCLQVF